MMAAIGAAFCPSAAIANITSRATERIAISLASSALLD
jgi:hypothetical protein